MADDTARRGQLLYSNVRSIHWRQGGRPGATSNMTKINNCRPVKKNITHSPAPCSIATALKLARQVPKLHIDDLVRQYLPSEGHLYTIYSP